MKHGVVWYWPMLGSCGGNHWPGGKYWQPTAGFMGFGH